MSLERGELVAAGCGVCGEITRADASPTACFQCGAVYPPNGTAPLLLVWLEVVFDGGVGVRTRIEHVGDWPAEERARAERAALRVIEGGAGERDE